MEKNEEEENIFYSSFFLLVFYVFLYIFLTIIKWKFFSFFFKISTLFPKISMFFRVVFIFPTFLLLERDNLMPHFTGFALCPAFKLSETIVCAISEKTCELTKLTDLYDPNGRIGPPSGIHESRCFKLESLPRMFSLGSKVLVVYLYREKLCTFIEETSVVYSKSILSENELPDPTFLYHNKPGFSRNSNLYPPINITEEQDNGPFFWQDVSVLSVALQKRVFLAVLGKSEHKGFSYNDIEISVKSGRLRFLSRLNYILKRIIPHLLHNQILFRLFPHCAHQSFLDQKYCLLGNYFHKVPRFHGTPCLHCPTQSECTPQGNINPFVCSYLKSWEERETMK